MPSPQARGYSLELNILLYKESRNGDVNSYDAFNISPVILSIPADLLFLMEILLFVVRSRKILNPNHYRNSVHLKSFHQNYFLVQPLQIKI